MWEGTLRPHRTVQYGPLLFRGSGLQPRHEIRTLFGPLGPEATPQVARGVWRPSGAGPHPLPINPPAVLGHSNPNELFPRRPPGMMVERCRPLVEPSRMRRLLKPKTLAIEMVAELMAQRAQERPERSHALLHCRPRPDSNRRCARRVITKKLGRPAALANADRSCGQSANSWFRNAIETRSRRHEFGASDLNGGRLAVFHQRFDRAS